MLANVISFIKTTDEIFLPEKIYYVRAISNGSHIYTKADVDPHTGIPTGEGALIYYEESTGSTVEYNVTYLPETTTVSELENGDTLTIIHQVVIKLNVETGEVDQNAIITRTTDTITNTIEAETVVRYSPANVLLGHVYRFKFLSDFAVLGYNVEAENPSETGMYRVDQILSYRDLLLQDEELSLYENLYEPLKLTKELFASDEERFTDEVTFYKLVDPTDEEIVYYMPDIFIDDHPDTNVKEFHKVMLGFTLGIFADPEQFSDLKESIRALLETKYGITTDADVFTYKEAYLTQQDYDAVVEERIQTRNNSTVDLHDTLFLNDKGIKEKEILALRSKVVAYEELLTQLT